MSKYLAMKYAGQGTQDLVPDFSNLQAVAKFDQASSVEAFDFEGIIYPFIVEWFMRWIYAMIHAIEFPSANRAWLFLPLRRFTNPEHVTDHASLNKQVDLLEGKLEGYERILSKQRYLAGDVSVFCSSSRKLHLYVYSRSDCRTSPSLTYSTCPTERWSLVFLQRTRSITRRGRMLLDGGKSCRRGRPGSR